jgi:hypothetical protein
MRGYNTSKSKEKSFFFVNGETSAEDMYLLITEEYKRKDVVVVSHDWGSFVHYFLLTFPNAQKIIKKSVFLTIPPVLEFRDVKKKLKIENIWVYKTIIEKLLHVFISNSLFIRVQIQRKQFCHFKTNSRRQKPQILHNTRYQEIRTSMGRRKRH